jgi:hypothetical protein
VFLNIKRTVALFVCLASALLAEAAGPHGIGARNLWRGPDPFTPYDKAARAPASWESGRLQGVRVVWMKHDRAQSLALLFIACLCLVTLEMKVLRRSTGKQDLQATRLADALRSGVLEFDGGLRTASTSLWENWADDEPDEAATPEPERIMSRYPLLGYTSGSDDSTQNDMHSMRCLSAGEEPIAPIRDEDLLLGMPREFLRPDLLEQAEERKPRRPRLANTAGDAE